MNFRADGSTFGENMSFNSPGGGGGGFLEKTFGESPLSQEKREEKTGAVPVTVAAIFNAEYDIGVDGLVIDGVHIHQVIIIGMIVKVVAKPLYSNFAIQDHTGGQIKVTKWVDHQESPEDEPEDTLREDTWGSMAW
ncbi:replication factor A protein 2-like [Xenia sp. Carnegie-2017]|uniref:replication factor A protein 2-like n=1 Tax=Xenia sp. Carnegie-2017 TaxID=2897299 RepID=UPI001F045232|nr:replication factor A protein 2-like [Xenia sp. Carnegie-2017]